MARPRKTPITDPKAKPAVRGKRLKSLRQMAGYTREKFWKNYAIPAGTLQGWECGRFGGLTESGAKRFIKAIREAGIECSEDWLLYGIGPAPRPTDKLYLQDGGSNGSLASHLEGVYDPNVLAELEVFKHHYPEAVYAVVQDRSMAPRFMQHECVAGVRRTGGAIASASGHDCIIELHNGNKLVRQFQLDQQPNRYNLVAAGSDIQSAVISQDEIVCVAPVIWQRRTDPKD